MATFLFQQIIRVDVHLFIWFLVMLMLNSDQNITNGSPRKCFSSILETFYFDSYVVVMKEREGDWQISTTISQNNCHFNRNKLSKLPSSWFFYRNEHHNIVKGVLK